MNFDRKRGNTCFPIVYRYTGVDFVVNMLTNALQTGHFILHEVPATPLLTSTLFERRIARLTPNSILYLIPGRVHWTFRPIVMSEWPTIRPQSETGPERAIICNNMPSLRVQIVRFVDEHQPEFVECQFRDADGQMHSIIDKLPCFTSAELRSDSKYPQPGEVECRVLGLPVDGVVTITLAEPYAVEATDGKSEFVVAEGDLTP